MRPMRTVQVLMKGPTDQQSDECGPSVIEVIRTILGKNCALPWLLLKGLYRLILRNNLIVCPYVQDVIVKNMSILHTSILQYYIRNNVGIQIVIYNLSYINTYTQIS